jgi:hypothetical protein
MCVKIAAMVRAPAGRFDSSGGRVKMFDKNLVHAIIGGKDLDCGSAELPLFRDSPGSVRIAVNHPRSLRLRAAPTGWEQPANLDL